MKSIFKHITNSSAVRFLWLTLVLLCALFYSNSASAAHQLGGEIYYDYLGNNTYRVHVIIYRDGNHTTAFDNPLSLGVFLSNNTLFNNYNIALASDDPIAVNVNNPCMTPPTGIFVERGVYVQDIVLPPIVGGYTLVHQRCCRGPSISNLNLPGETGMTLVTNIPGSETGAQFNSSPRFNNFPPLIICNNDELVFDYSATDPDGDQIQYSFETPFHGASSADPKPAIPPPPPYPYITWKTNHNAANPFGPGSTNSLDPVTGLLKASPNLTGKYVVAVKAEEVRNGVVINSTLRDFVFVVIACDIELIAILPYQHELDNSAGPCGGLEINFENKFETSSNQFSKNKFEQFGCRTKKHKHNKRNTFGKQLEPQFEHMFETQF